MKKYLSKLFEKIFFPIYDFVEGMEIRDYKY